MKAVNTYTNSNTVARSFPHFKSKSMTKNRELSQSKVSKFAIEVKAKFSGFKALKFDEKADPC